MPIAATPAATTHAPGDNAASAVPPASGSWSTASTDCKDCGAALTGFYCARCGQEARIETPTVAEFAREFLQDQIALEGKLLRTLKVLAGKPGQLTLDYVDGRRQRYIRPLRLYLTMSVIYFAVSGLAGTNSLDFSSPDAASQNKGTAETQAADAEKVDAGDDANASDGDSAGDEPAPMSAAAKARHDKAAPAKADQKSEQKKDEPDTISDADYRKLSQLKLGYAPLDARLESFFGHPPKEAASRFVQALRSDAPVAIFFVLPLFAALLKLGYFSHHLRYGVHLLFSLHFHAFVFVDLLLATIPWPGIVATLLNLAIPAYLVMALRRVYGGGRASTIFGALVLLTVYSIFIGIALLAGAVVSLALNA